MFKKSIATAFVALGVATSALAQSWQPTKPVEAVMAWTPGSANEIIFRTLAKQVETNTSAKFVVVNRPGAGGVVGTEYFSKLPADGYAVTMVSVPGITAMDKVAVPDTNGRSYTTDSFVYPLLGASAHFVIVTQPDDPVSTPEQLVASLKNEKSTFDASGGARLVFETLQARLKFPLGDAGVVRVEHKGPVDTLNAVAGKHIRFAVIPVSVAYPFIQDNRVKVVALSGSKPLKQLPRARLLNSAVPGFDVTAGWGLMLHKDTPPAVVNWYTTEFGRALKSDEVKAIFESNLYQEEPQLQNPKAFGDYVRRLEKQYQPLVDSILAQIKNPSK